MVIILAYGITLSLLYILVFTDLFLAWKNYNKHETRSGQRFLSLVVPVYNNINGLEKLIDSIGNQDYPDELFELIIVDDHSSPPVTIPEYQYKGLTVKLLRNKFEKGKKYALKTGIEAASGETIITTDVDCLPGRTWLSSVSSMIPDIEPFFISLPVFMNYKGGAFHKFQSLEFSSLVATGAASFAKGSPVMCNGANLAFSKDLFMEAFPLMKPGIPSGDDMFLMLYTKKRYRSNMFFGKDPDAVVETDPERIARDFLIQRTRWSSKSLFYRDGYLVFLSTLILLLSISIITLAVFGIIDKSQYLPGFLVLFISKSIMDFFFLNTFLGFFNRRKMLNFFLPSLFLWPFYIVFAAFSGFVSFFKGLSIK